MRFRILSLCGLALFAASGRAAVSLEPPGIHLQGPGAAQRFLVRGGNACTVTSRDPDIVGVEGNRLVGRRAGAAELSVHCAEGSSRAAVRVGKGNADVEINFARDLLSIFTTKGCNSAACHGSPAGQNGFKLSLYGSDAKADHEMIARRSDGRRISLETPEDSLLLTKPSFRTAHGGGQLMTRESDEYRTILNWIRQGAEYESSGIGLERLEMHPGESVLVGAGVAQPLVVIGRLSDGSTRDMSDEVRYSVNDIAVISEVENGRVTSKGRGLTTVTARAMGKVATAQFIVVHDAAGDEYQALSPNNFIDEHIFRKLREVNIEPFAPTSDRTFVRRVFLDAAGVLPTTDEAESFVASQDPGKRPQLIDRLLDRKEYAPHWLVKFEDWFRNSQYYSQGRTNGSYKRWLYDLIREDKPYDAAVREMITATGDTTVRPAGNFWHPAIDFMLKKFEIEKAAPTVTRLFLGQRIECAQCHNHPLENLTQDDFYGMAAFLARMQVKHGYGQYRRVWYNKRHGEIAHPVTGKPVAPKFLDGELADIAAGADRREALADWITRARKMQFARATVNRIWYEYFGRGIVEPFDDFRSTNRATHPRLLDDLARHFIDSGFRFKAVHRLILNSKTYQLSAHTADRVGGEDALEEILFARYIPRKLPAEVLLDAISQVTNSPEKFRGYPPGTSPKELIASIGATYFLTAFGHPRRDVMQARSNAPSLAQALHMMNGDVLKERLAEQDNILSSLIGRGLSDREIVGKLYMRAYSAAPAPHNSDAIAHYLASERNAGRSRRRGLENVLWAILNAKEFQLNR